jgi:hypothetical protein
MGSERHWRYGGEHGAARQDSDPAAMPVPGRRTLVESSMAGGWESPHAPEASISPVQRQTCGAAAAQRPAMTTGASIDRLFGGHTHAVVQRRIAGRVPEPDTESVHVAAARGVAAPRESLPFADRIQAAFGPRYSVASIDAHVGGAATEASAAMGASAYATGNHVVFANAPDLHTAAHEAAHVVQQAHGVNLYGGVGQAGDLHERHADAVADAVVAGRSAEPLLDHYSGRGGATVQRQQVQRAIRKPGEAAHYTVEEVRQLPWYKTLGSEARRKHIEQLAGEPAETSNLTVEQAIQDVNEKVPRPVLKPTVSAHHDEDSDAWFKMMLQEPTSVSGPTSMPKSTAVPSKPGASLSPTAQSDQRETPTLGIKPATKPMSLTSPSSGVPSRSTRSSALHVRRIPDHENMFANWSDDEDEIMPTKPTQQPVPRSLALPSEKSIVSPPRSSKPTAEPTMRAPEQQSSFANWSDDDWDIVPTKPAQQPVPRSLALPSEKSISSPPRPRQSSAHDEESDLFASAEHPRFGYSMHSTPSIKSRATASKSEKASFADTEADLRMASPVKADVKSEDKAFLREHGTRVWATSKAKSGNRTVENEYRALDLIRSHGVPTVLAGNLSAVRTSSQSTIGFPMNWVEGGISSKSQAGPFKDQLQKLSGAKLMAAKQDLQVMQGFLAKYVVQDFQVILDPVSGRILVNDPRGCHERTPEDSTSGDLQRVVGWLAEAGSKPSGSTTGASGDSEICLVM